MTQPPTDYLHAGRVIRSRLTTTEHQRIALMIFVAVTRAIMLAGACALRLRPHPLFT